MKNNVLLGLIFLLPILLALVWFVAPHDAAFGWFPRNINTAYGQEVDTLYLVIMTVVAVMFFLTEGLLVYFLFRYQEREGRKARYSHGNKKAELLWSVVPGLMLVALALGQSGTWAKVRRDFPSESDPGVVHVQVFAQQFDWSFRYPGNDAAFGTTDDVGTRQLTVPTDRKVLLRIASKDVIHSLFLPHLRVKQDVVPGMLGKIWFVAGEIPVWRLRTKGEALPPERQEMVWMTPEEFRRNKVASNFESPGAFTFRNDQEDPERLKRDKTGMLRFWYEVDRSKTVEIWKDGAAYPARADEAEYVIHQADLACAELCGPQHWTMASSIKILPPEIYDSWIPRQGRTDVNTQFETVWDKSYPHYNR